jgi:hypothetical protein
VMSQVCGSVARRVLSCVYTFMVIFYFRLQSD